MKKIDDLSGYDKASIIVDLLGDSLSLNIFSDITESEFIKLRRHAKKIGPIVSSSVKKEVLDDYYFKMLSVEKYQQVSLNKNMFDFLNDLDAEQLYELLSNETPRVIALALEQIDNKKRMSFLSRINHEIQTQAVLQTGNLNDIPLETVIHIAKDLKKKVSFLPGPVEFSRGGGKSVSDMLSKMSEDDAEKYLNKMKLDNPELLTDVKKYFLLFDDIINMPERMALEFWGDPDIDLQMMAKALKECNAETVERIHGYLPGKKKAMFSPISEEEPLPKRELDEAKGEIKNLLQKKIDTGEMNIEDILVAEPQQ
tara:strand:- start:364 stop:1299 length:936 start_codon:yes stop_codon:yes gene_type:complete